MRKLTVIPALLLAAFAVVYFHPELMAPGPLHPRSIANFIRGERLHPWVAQDPARTYNITFWDIRWPLFRKDILNYEGYLDYLVQGFTVTHPNVRVDIRLFDLSLDEGRLWQALSTGEHPDVVSAAFEPWLVQKGMLADLTAMFDARDRDTFIPSVVSALTYSGRVWAYPRWLDIEFMAGNATILQKAGLDFAAVLRNGWTWEDLMTLAERVKAQGVVPLVPASANCLGLEAIVRSMGGQPAFDPAGNLIWEEKDLAPATSLLDQMLKKRILPDPPGGLEGSMLPRFMTGKIGIVGPVRSSILRSVKERDMGLLPSPAALGRGMDLAILPVPTLSREAPVLTAGLTSLMVFESDDPGRMKAAADFARYLATVHAPKITDALQVVSCTRENVRATVKSLATKLDASWIITCLDSGRTTILPAETAFGSERYSGQKRIDPVVRAFWQRPVPARDLVQALHRAMAGLASPPARLPAGYSIATTSATSPSLPGETATSSRRQRR